MLDVLLVQVVNPHCGVYRGKPQGKGMQLAEHGLVTCTSCEANRLVSSYEVLLVSSSSVDHESALAADGHDVSLGFGKISEQVVQAELTVS